jgi:hypothetical protein
MVSHEHDEEKRQTGGLTLKCFPHGCYFEIVNNLTAAIIKKLIDILPTSCYSVKNLTKEGGNKMEKGFGKLSATLSFMERIAEGFGSYIKEIKRFNDTLEGVSTEIKRYNDLQEGHRVEQIREKEKPRQRTPRAVVRTRATKRAKAAAVEQPSAPAKKEKIARAPEKGKKVAPKRTQTIPDVLYKSIMVVSKLKPEFPPGEVIDRAAKSLRGTGKKDSLRTALQGFKVGSKTANRLQHSYRDLIAPVEGQKGMYRLNPEKAKSE